MTVVRVRGASNLPAEWDLIGRRVMITGATNGIGKEAARQLAARGATVVLACRNLPAAERVADEIRQQHPGATVEVGPAQLDLGSLESVRAFADAYRKSGKGLDVLINNAGANYCKESYTPEGVGALCQVNYLGPYALTRELEETLQRSAPARVVNVSSVTHRYGWIGDPTTFLSSWRPGSYYPSTKLANALFAFELQRRLGAAGIQSCAVDPGGVSTNIWQNSAFDKPPLSYFIRNLYAPPSDGAAAVVHAATVPWILEHKAAADITRRWAGGSSGGVRRRKAAQTLPDLRFYARGLFASPAVTSWRGTVEPSTLADQLRSYLWGGVTVVHSLLDWPLRNLSGGWLAAETRPVPAAPLAYDAALAAQLWDLSADICKLPRQPRLVQSRP